MSLIRARYRAVNTIMNLPRGGGYVGLLDLFPNAAAAYSLRKLRAAYSGSAVRVRRSSDNTEQDIGFDSNGDLDTTALLAFVNSGEVFTNPDITSATGWSLGANTTYNASTEAFDLVSENGLTVRQEKSVNGHTFAITIVVDSVTSGGIKIYAGGTQSAVISTAGTHTLNIVGGSSNTILGINPNGTSTCSISSFSAIDTTADGLVSTWYDQSLSNNATQSTGANQPKIVSGGSLVVMGGASKAAIEGSTSSLSLTTALTPTDFSIIHTSEGSGFVANIGDHIRISTYYRYNIDGNNYTSSDADSSQPSIYIGNRNGTTLNLRRNGSEMDSSPHTSVATALNITTIFNRSTLYFVGKISEFIIFESNQSSNFSGIETNLNTFYSIYP